MTTLDRHTFDLTVQPWVTVVGENNVVRDVSLREALVNAHEYRRLGGEVPTQSAAMLRLLLAILRRVHPHARTPQDWATLWNKGRFDPVRVNDYLALHRERFDLLHPETPFFQVAGLHTAQDELTQLVRLVPDVPPRLGRRHFTTRAGHQTGAMSFAEAARWIVHAQAYDPAGTKTGAVGDKRVKNGKGYAEAPWCGRLGLIVVEGPNLFETLMHNLPLDPSWGEDDLPPWERPPIGPGIELRPGAPTGPVDLLTWQSRRIRLGHNREHVTGVLIANGDPLSPINRFRDETMTGWRRDETREKAAKSPEPLYMPYVHTPDRAVWRGLSSLLAGTEPGASVRAGTWLEWLGKLKQEEILPPSYALRLRTVGMRYVGKPTPSLIEDITDDVLQLSLSVLSDPQLKALAIDAVADVDAAVRVLGQFADELARAAGADRELGASRRGEAREQGYAALDAPYRAWVRTLSPDTDLDPTRAAWQHRVRREVIAVMRHLLDSASPAAWSGVFIDDDLHRPLNAATATNWFYLNLAKALPLTRQPAEGATS